jgi:hypothetical protein
MGETSNASGAEHTPVVGSFYQYSGKAIKIAIISNTNEVKIRIFLLFLIRPIMLNIRIIIGRIQSPISHDKNIGIEVNKEKNIFINPLL